MNRYCIPDWDTMEQSRSSHNLLPIFSETPEQELTELLWQNGHVVIQSQSKMPSSSVPEPKFDPSAWLEYQADDPLGGAFPELFSEIPGIDAGGAAAGLGEPSACGRNRADTDTSHGLGVRAAKDATALQTIVSDPTLTSSTSGGSDSSIGRTIKRSLKRKGRVDTEDSEYQCEVRSDADYDSVGANRPKAQRSTRKSRAAEVHNLSERRRRDRINEKMKALQELMPHCNKTDKASMLDEAITYMKSLQLQVQIMWMGSGIAPMMFPNFHQYVSPSVDNMVRLPRTPTPSTSPPVPSPVNCLVRTQNGHVPESSTRYVGFTNEQLTQSMNFYANGTLTMAGISSHKQ